MARPPLSLIREFYEAAQAKWPDQPRRELVEYAVASVKLEIREGERGAEAELAEGLYDLANQEGSPEDDYDGELPW